MEEFEPKEYKNKYNIEISPKHTHTNRLFKFQKNSATYRGEKDIETQIILNRIIP